ncbi:family 2 glycosyl transferase [Ectothiorhodospira sp. PHS-1]|uniref:glycosyltransferase family 2 protein n=1 Tax=Ectothiorhodospira sp. PHS-1 TaxID=519989 RepID=UPI00024A8823|nr:glycosyltransferase family 2 protein [Ectothiorhodospira sp. PHS-1]EHQ51856.1 family 2 glycosyl transferase [Ectothiorhodospira sp. PHS-1]
MSVKPEGDAVAAQAVTDDQGYAVYRTEEALSLSLVIPMYNEEDNVAPLVARIHEALGDLPMPWEVVLVDDGSADATPDRMLAAREQYGRHVRVLTLQRNFGQTAAMQAGIDHARGSVIATLDGDLQNDPADIPVMVRRLLDEDLDMVAGWRKDRHDDLWKRKVPSRIANRLIRWTTKVNLHDYGCSLKVFRAQVLKGVRLYGEMHRFIPAWFATQTSPRRIREHVVTHHPRAHGDSKYGISRTFRVILDLLSVYFFMRYKARPGHFFGSIGLFFGALGSAILGYLLLIKVLLQADIGTRPLLFVGVMCVLVSVQLLTTGVLSELMARTYFESGRIRSYVVRERNREDAAGDDWRRPG